MRVPDSAQTANCHRCGADVKATAKFCSECGAPRETESKDTSSTEQTGYQLASGRARAAVIEKPSDAAEIAPPDTSSGPSLGNVFARFLIGTLLFVIIGIAAGLWTVWFIPALVACIAGLLITFNILASAKKVAASRLWRFTLFMPPKRPRLFGVLLLAWACLVALTAVIKIGNAQVERQNATATAVAVARARATSEAIAAVTAVAQRTEVAKAHARATAGAIAQKTAAPHETATAVAHARLLALTRAHAQATAQVRARVHAQATAQAKRTAALRASRTATAQAVAREAAIAHETATATVRVRLIELARAHAQATAQTRARAHVRATAQAVAQAHAFATQLAQPSNDTYADVNDHPDLYQGNYIQWTCNINKFLGDDPNTFNTDVTCQEYIGKYDGTGDGEILLSVPPNIDTGSMDAGDDVRVYGRVDQPFQGINSYGGPVTEPQIDVKSMTDLGHDPNASS